MSTATPVSTHSHATLSNVEDGISRHQQAPAGWLPAFLEIVRVRY
jgi:hypothetical protein